MVLCGPQCHGMYCLSSNGGIFLRTRVLGGSHLAMTVATRENWHLSKCVMTYDGRVRWGLFWHSHSGLTSVWAL